MQVKEIAVYGAGGFGREVAWLVQTIAMAGNSVDVVCFIDDDCNVHGTDLNGITILSLEQAKKLYPNACVVSGCGDPRIREITMTNALNQGFSFATIVHPRTEMSDKIEMGEGTVICAGNILTTNIMLEKHVQINLDCTIGHDVIMDDYSTLAPGVHVSGYVHIGKRAYIGTGAVILNGTKDNPLMIGDDVVVGAGSVSYTHLRAHET